MRIIKENKLDEGLGILDYEVRGNYTLISISSIDIDYSIKEINKNLSQYKGRAYKVSDGLIRISTENLVNFALAHLG